MTPNELHIIEFNTYVRTFCQENNVAEKDILSKRRDSHHTIQCRQHLWFDLHDMGYPYAEIARRLNRDHSTIMYGVKKFKKGLENGSRNQGTYNSRALHKQDGNNVFATTERKGKPISKTDVWAGVKTSG